MGILDFLTRREKNTASVAKNRLQILIQQERSLLLLLTFRDPRERR